MPKPFKCLILIDCKVGAGFRADLSRKIVDSVCLYAMAWGKECSLWDDSIEHAVVEKYEGLIPDDRFVMTTWHEAEPLEDAMFFAKRVALLSYNDVPLATLLVFDIGQHERRSYVHNLYDQS